MTIKEISAALHTYSSVTVQAGRSKPKVRTSYCVENRKPGYQVRGQRLELSILFDGIEKAYKT